MFGSTYFLNIIVSKIFTQIFNNVKQDELWVPIFSVLYHIYPVSRGKTIH
jgi:hypothetical protein